MTDIVDRSTRSRMMRGIGGRDTKPEMALRRYLHSLGYRYRLHRRDLPGSPDLVLSRHRLAILVHGCFWHRHGGCFYATTPKTRQTFWEDKFSSNIQRDRRVSFELGRLEWRVLVVWECGFKHLRHRMSDIPLMIECSDRYLEWPPVPPRRR
ncbi:very short patch repair endonuclease [Halomonas salifodinae]|uniref:very short patch repair endonuclease n=1 Tax=Halomonas salifodinae TaxID=438745 RepID=UPI00339E044A